MLSRATTYDIELVQKTSVSLANVAWAKPCCKGGLLPVPPDLASSVELGSALQT